MTQRTLKQQKTADTCCDPAFLRKRVDAYYHERVEKMWRGQHPLKGCVPKSGDLVLMSNDYLALYNHPNIIKAQKQALDSSYKDDANSMSAVFLGGDSPQSHFEQEIAKFTGYEAGMLFISGWDANVGLLQSIANQDTPVYIDMCAHYSLWQGIMSANAPSVPFVHNNIAHLEKMVQKHGPGIVVVDSLYSVGGDFAPIKEIVDVAARYGCVVVVDEAHSLGVYGKQGCGLVAKLGLQDKVHFVTVSLAKAFASRGGLVLGSARNIEYLRYEAKPAIFSTAVLDDEVVRFDATLKMIKFSKGKRRDLLDKAAYVCSELDKMGYSLTSQQSAIVGLYPGDERQLIVLRDALNKRGIYGAPFFPPATPKYQTCMRFTLNSATKEEDIDRLLSACYEIRQEVGMFDWTSTRLKKKPPATKVYTTKAEAA